MFDTINEMQNKTRYTFHKCFAPDLHVGFRAETKMIMAGEEESNSSFPYDDIEVVDAQPLTSEATAVVASQQNYLNESVPDQNTGKFLCFLSYLLLN